MKKISLILVLLVNLGVLYAQTANVVFYTEDEETFYLSVEGLIQNKKPLSKVKVEGIAQDFFKVKFVFTDPSIPPLERNVSAEMGQEWVYKVKKKSNGKYGIVLFQEKAISKERQTGPTDKEIEQFGKLQNQTLKFLKDASEIEVGGSSTETQHTQHTEIHHHHHQQGGFPTTVHVVEEYRYPGYNGPIGCPGVPMEPIDFNDAKRSVTSKDFPNEKMKIAQQIVRNHCMLVDQVKSLMLAFDFENDRLKLAKFAYDYTHDIGNYYKLNDAFDFPNTVDQLDDYVKTK